MVAHPKEALKKIFEELKNKCINQSIFKNNINSEKVYLSSDTGFINEPAINNI